MQPISDGSFERLATVLEGFMPLSVQLKLELKDALREVSLPANKLLLNVGQVQHVVWFLLSGLAREFREDPVTLEEKTSWFWTADGFLFDDSAFFAQEPSYRGIQLLDKSQVVCLSYTDFKLLQQGFLEVQLLSEKVRGHYSRLRKRHGEESHALSAMQRYLSEQTLLDQLWGKVKLRHVSEFMRMAPDTLGRLRKQLIKR